MSATVIAAHTRIDGALSSDGDLVIEGAVSGEVRSTGQLTLGAEAEVGGPIRAREVRIAGRLMHNVHAEGLVHLLPTAEVIGDLEAGRLVIDDGAIFEGQVRLRRSGNAPRALAARAGTAGAAPPPRALPTARVAPRHSLGPSVPGPAPSEPAQAAPPAARLIPALPAPGRRRLQRRGPA